MKKQTGKELEAAMIEEGHNALWIKGRGMIIMANSWGTDILASGTYRLLSAATCADILADREDVEHAKYVAWQRGGKTYKVD